MTKHRCVECGSFNTAPVVESDVNKVKGGRTPYGFVAIDGRYQYEPFMTGPYMALLVREHANGLTYRDLATYLNEQHVPAPAGGQWSHAIVRRVVEQGKRLSHLIPLSEVL